MPDPTNNLLSRTATGHETSSWGERPQSRFRTSGPLALGPLGPTLRLPLRHAAQGEPRAPSPRRLASPGATVGLRGFCLVSIARWPSY